MQRLNFSQRVLKPLVFVFLTMIISRIVYFNSRLIDNDTLYQTIAFTSGAIHFVSIEFGALLIYPIAYFNGSGRIERIVACLITPAVWNCIEIYNVSETFSFLESLYYGLNSLALLTFIGTFALMGVSELACRYKIKKRGSKIKIITPTPIIGIIGHFITIYLTAVWGNGTHWFYLFKNGYIALFGN
jgi:hypothetical protein